LTQALSIVVAFMFTKPGSALLGITLGGLAAGGLLAWALRGSALIPPSRTRHAA